MSLAAPPPAAAPMTTTTSAPTPAQPQPTTAAKPADQPPPLESVNTAVTTTITAPVTTTRPAITSSANTQPIKWIAIQTVQANCNLNVKVDLRAVASKARNAVYEPRQRSGAVVLQCKQPRATAHIFNSGAMVLIGSGSETDMKISARKIARQIQLALIQSSADIESAQLIINNLRLTGYRVNNVGGSGSIGFTVDLERLSTSIEYGDDVTYDPERFPGAQYKLFNPDVSTTIFYNGSVTITGGKCENDIYVSYDKLYRLLTGYANSPIPPPSVQVQRITHRPAATGGGVTAVPALMPQAGGSANKRQKLGADDPDNLDFDNIQWE